MLYLNPEKLRVVIMDKTSYCYWCGKPATSKEHVPPKCLFPEQKDIKDIYDESFRIDLITVPSCNEHNMKKSNDDEYLMTCLAGRVGNNGIAFVHNSTEIKRTLSRKPHLFKVDEETVIDIGGIKFPVLWVTVDTVRLSHSLESIARAIYYHEFGEPFLGNCIVISRMFFSLEDKNSTVFHRRASKLIQSEQPYWKTEIKGSNPKIFTYQFSPIDGLGIRTLLLNFFEKSLVYVVLSTIDESNIEQYKTQFEPILDALFGDLK